MNSSIIRLAKKIVITANETNSDLQQLWNAINGSIADLNNRRAGQRLTWKSIYNRYKQDLNREASDYGQGILQLLGNRFPNNLQLTSTERELRVEMVRTEISDFAEEVNSLELHYFLITEQLLLIDSIGDRLLLAKSSQIEALQKGEPINDTFTVNLVDDYDIVEYTKVS